MKNMHSLALHINVRYDNGLSDIKDYVIELVTPADAFVTAEDLRKEEEEEIIRVELEREAVCISFIDTTE